MTPEGSNLGSWDVPNWSFWGVRKWVILGSEMGSKIGVQNGVKMGYPVLGVILPQIKPNPIVLALYGDLEGQKWG